MKGHALYPKGNNYRRLCSIYSYINDLTLHGYILRLYRITVISIFIFL